MGYALYTSTKNSDGYGDIKIFITGEPVVRDTVPVAPPDTVKIVEIHREPAADKRVKVYGKVTNAKTGEAIKAAIFFTSPSVTESSNASLEEGYNVLVPSTEQYSVKIEATGYISALEKLDIQTYEMKELEMNFKLQPVEIGATVNLEMYFLNKEKRICWINPIPNSTWLFRFLNQIRR